MREAWMQGGPGCFYFCSFVFIFMMQAGMSILWNFSLVYIFSFSDNHSLGVLDYAGIAVWLVGFTIEIIADYQLY